MAHTFVRNNIFINSPVWTISQKCVATVANIDQKSFHSFVSHMGFKKQEDRNKLIKVLQTLDAIELKQIIFDKLEAEWFVKLKSPRKNLTSITEVEVLQMKLNEKESLCENLQEQLKAANIENIQLKMKLAEKAAEVNILNQSVAHHRQIQMIRERNEPTKPKPNFNRFA